MLIPNQSRALPAGSPTLQRAIVNPVERHPRRRPPRPPKLPELDAMKHNTSQALFTYWNEVRNGRPAPRRFDIEPGRISHILSDTLILERLDFETYRFRLAGTDVCNLFGFELRGEEFFTLWEEEGDRITFERALSRITRHCEVGVFEFTGVAACGTPVTCELVLLPLIHNGSRIDRLVGAISPAYAPGWTTRSVLADRRLVSDKLITPATVDPETLGADAVAADGPEVLDDRQSPFAADIRSARIVRSDRRQFRVYDGGLSD